MYLYESSYLQKYSYLEVRPYLNQTVLIDSY